MPTLRISQTLRCSTGRGICGYYLPGLDLDYPDKWFHIKTRVFCTA